MNIDDILYPYTTSYTLNQRVYIIAKERSGKEFKGEGHYTGAGNWVPVNDYENVFVPIFACPNIPDGHYFDLQINRSTD